MRAAALILAAVPTLTTVARACPDDEVTTSVSTEAGPATSTPVCMTGIDLRIVRRVLQLGYTVGAGGLTRTGIGGAATAFAGLELGYGLAFGGEPAAPSYEVGVHGGASVHRTTGDAAATSLVTHGRARLGPAQVPASVVDEARGNFAFFPLTMELAHTGELGARPRLAARPELARALYGRERLELATRIMRVEGAGTKPQSAAPGATEPKAASNWALDFIPLHGGLDVALQDATRFETTIGGAMLGVVEHTTGTSLELFALEHRRVDLPMMSTTTSLDTIWMLRIDGVDPFTGSQYHVGWGETLAGADHQVLARELDPEGTTVAIGGAGWYTRRSWGGLGAQYKREPFMTMTGEIALEDRVSGELYLANRLGVVGRAFAARTLRVVDDRVRSDMTTGVELDATYVRDGFTSRLGLELGRTFYAALDDAAPDRTGFAASLGLSLQHTGRRSWQR